MNRGEPIQHILNCYAAAEQFGAIESLGTAGGFSGALFWRLTSWQGPLCLRRWPPEHPGAARLAFIHRVLRDVDQCGACPVPAPLLTRAGDSYVQDTRGYLWELTPWLPGVADFSRHPSLRRLRNVMHALAQFHRAAQTSGEACGSPQRKGRSPGLRARLKQLRATADVCQELKRASSGVAWPELEERARAVLQTAPPLAQSLLQDLQQASRVELPLQPCIRDVWHDHVLFDGQEVSGLVDFGAMRVETVAGDLARLLGSLVGDDPDRWLTGLQAYEEVRPLCPQERSVVQPFDSSAVLLSALNWLVWIYLEGRQFDDRRRVERRLDALLKRLMQRA